MVVSFRTVALAALFALAVDAKSIFGNVESTGNLKGNRSGAVCSDATMKPFRQCLSSFYASWGYDLNKMPSLKIWGGVVQDLINAQGKDGIRDVVCKRQQAMDSCIALIPNGKSCENTASYKVIFGNIEGSSDEYLEWNDQYAYVCGPAENRYLANFDCITQAEKTYEADQEKCERNYGDDIKQGLGTCVAYTNYVVCREAIYTKACGLQVYDIICNLMELPFQAEYPDCGAEAITCKP